MSQQGMSRMDSVDAPKPTERDGPVLWITFNRPSRLNAATRDMERRLVAACDFVNDTPDIRAMVSYRASQAPSLRSWPATTSADRQHGISRGCPETGGRCRAEH